MPEPGYVPSSIYEYCKDCDCFKTFKYQSQDSERATYVDDEGHYAWLPLPSYRSK